VLGMDGENLNAVAGLARCYLAGGDAARAKELLDMVPEEKANDPAIKGARAALGLAEQAGQEPKHDDDVNALIAHLSGAPGDHAKRFELAQALAARGDLEAAVGHLLEIIKANREWNDGAAKAELLKLFEAAGPMSSVTKDGRRRLSAILFS
jgi:putative thioredoxin